jgi:hypothetical protein
MNDPTEQKDRSRAGLFEFLDYPNPWVAVPLIIVLSVVLCVVYDWIFDADGQQQWVQRTIADGAFEISVPASWEFKHLRDDSPGRFGMDTWTDPQGKLSLWVSVFNKTAVDTATLPEFRDQRTSAYVSDLQLTDVDITHFNVASTRNSDTLDTVMIAAVDGKKVMHRFRHYDFENYWVEVMAMFTEDIPKRHQETIERVINSVHPTR